MHKTASRKRTAHSNYDLYDDVEKIKRALAIAAYDMKGKAGEVISQSLQDVKGRTEAFQENVASFAGEKPFKTIGIAFAAGLLIGYFLHYK